MEAAITKEALVLQNKEGVNVSVLQNMSQSSSPPFHNKAGEAKKYKFTSSTWKWVVCSTTRPTSPSSGKEESHPPAIAGDTALEIASESHISTAVYTRSTVSDILRRKLCSFSSRQKLLNSVCKNWLAAATTLIGTHENAIHAVILDIRDALCIRLEQLLDKLLPKLEGRQDFLQRPGEDKRIIDFVNTPVNIYDIEYSDKQEEAGRNKKCQADWRQSLRGQYGFSVEGPSGCGKSHFVHSLSLLAPWFTENYSFVYKAESNDFVNSSSTNDNQFDDIESRSRVHIINLSDYLILEKSVKADKVHHITSNEQANYYNRHSNESQMFIADTQAATSPYFSSESLESKLISITSEARGRNTLFCNWLSASPFENTSLTTSTTLSDSKIRSSPKDITLETAITAGGATFVLLEEYELFVWSSVGQRPYKGTSAKTLIMELLLQYWRIWMDENLAVFLFIPISTSSTGESSTSDEETDMYSTIFVSPLFLQFVENRIVLDTLLDEEDRYNVLLTCTKAHNVEPNLLRVVAGWTAGFLPSDLKLLVRYALLEGLKQRLNLTTVASSEMLSFSDEAEHHSSPQESLTIDYFTKALLKIDPRLLQELQRLVKTERYRPSAIYVSPFANVGNGIVPLRRISTDSAQETEAPIESLNSENYMEAVYGFDGICGENLLIERLKNEVVEPYKKCRKHPTSRAYDGMEVEAKECDLHSSTPPLPSPTGILIEGNPGSGKTAIARAIAWECRATLVTVNCGDVLRAAVGDSEKMMSTIMRRCRQVASSVVLLENVEEFAPNQDITFGQPGYESRLRTTEGSLHRTAAVLLDEIDAVQKSREFGNNSKYNTMFILTTRSKDLIDSRYLRPYRISRVYKTADFSSWSFADRTQLLSLLLNERFNAKTSFNESINKIAEALDRRLQQSYLNGHLLSAATIALLCQEAAVNAVRRFHIMSTPALDDESAAHNQSFRDFGIEETDVLAALDSHFNISSGCD